MKEDGEALPKTRHPSGDRVSKMTRSEQARKV